MRRRVARFFFVILFGAVATVLGTITAMLLTPPGRDLLARNVSAQLDRAVLGRVDVGYISGSFLYDLTLKRLVVRDTAGIVLANLPLVRVSYRLPSLLAGNIVLTGVTLDRPVIQLIKHRNGRMNYEEILRLGKGAPGGTSPLVELRNVRITDGSLRILLPWNPPPNARTAAQRDSALAAERARPGRRIETSAEGLRRVIALDPLTTRLSRLRITTPDHLPFTVDFDSIATRVSDPQVTLTDAAGRLRLHSDSAVFSLQRVSLPGTEAHGGGAITWPRDSMMYDFQLIAHQVDLADLRWVSPQFPDMTGYGTITAHSVSGDHVEYTLEDLHLRHLAQRVDGRLVAITDAHRGLGVRDLRLGLSALDLDAVRPYLDTLPFHGTITGTVKANGYLHAITTSVDWNFADALVPGRPVSHIVADGVIRTGKEGLVFDSVQVRSSDIDLGTVKQFAPAVALDGRLAASGLLDGPLKDVDFTGTIRHRDDDRPESVADGYIHLDTRRDTLALATDVTLDPLSFDGIRRAFPSLKTRGDLRGTFRSEGTLSHLTVAADVTGAIGAIAAQGTVTLLPPRFGADSLAVRFKGVDLAAVRDTGPATSLTGTLLVSGTMDTLRAPEGTVQLSLAPSSVRDFALDTLYARAAVQDSVIHVDSAYAGWKGARAGGSGTLGWARPHAGEMHFRLAADSLLPFDSLALALTHSTRDTSTALHPLNGTVDAAVTLSGSLDTLQAAGAFTLRNLAFQRLRGDLVSGGASWTGGTRPTVGLLVQTDSVFDGPTALRNVRFQLAGPADSVDWVGGVLVGALADVNASGRWWRRGAVQTVAMDTLRAALATRSWRLSRPATITLSDSAPSVSTLALTATDGSGAIQATGSIPGAQPGELTLEAIDVNAQDLYSLMGKDTSGVAGNIGINLQIGGRAAEPTLRGTVSLADARFSDARLPYLQGVLDYAARRLDANLLLWRTGAPVLSVEAQLPVDLAFESRTDRQLPGDLHVRLRADSVDLAIVEAVTSGLRDVSGTLAADVTVGGGWDLPELTGYAEVRNGAMSLPGLGVRYSRVGGRLELASDTLHLKNVALETGNGREADERGRLDVTGFVHLHNLAHPELGLHLAASNFRAIDVRNFLSLTATGGIDLKGPFYGATATGSITADNGVLYFADLVSKKIIDLSDPTIADLVDTTLIRRRGLGAGFSTAFVDQLNVADMKVALGSDFWLRSGEANIKLGGDVTASKVKKEYRLDGTLEAERGIYTLKIGPVSRDFTVTRGSVRYLGTPDLNAELDIAAEYDVHTVTNQEVPVIARITGTILAPKLALESTQRPPIPEADLVSYLITGAPVAEANVLGQGRAVESALAYLSSALSSEFERAVVSDLGLPIDLLEIRPGVLQGPTGSSLTQVTAGWQLGNKTFLTLNAGFCTQQNFGYQNVGASLERRFSRAWRAQISIEPTYQSCLATNIITFNSTSAYQVGADVFWEREF